MRPHGFVWPTPAKRLLACPHRPPCPGCPRFGEAGLDPVVRATLDTLARAHGLAAVPVTSGASEGFRLRARLAIRGRRGSPKIGLFELDSHRVVHVPNCRVHHPLINEVASVVRRALAETRVTCYSDAAHLGVARYLQVVVERRSQTAQVVIVGNCETPEPLAAAFALIEERLGHRLHSLWFNANRGTSNVILGSHFQRWCGPPAVVECFGGALVHYPPGAFGQSNLELAGAVIARVRELVDPGARVVEFYAGVGAIGLSLLDRVGRLDLNEINPHSLQGLDLGLAALGPPHCPVSVIRGPAGEAAPAAAGADVVIADPPRKGLDPQLLEQLRREPPSRFIYVSCGLDSLLDDAARLTAGGTLRIGTLAAFDVLPYTGHVETIACFERAAPAA